MFADFVDGDDVGVVETGGGLGLVVKAVAGFGGTEAFLLDHFEGDDPAGVFLLGFINDAHSSSIEEFENPVIADPALRLDLGREGVGTQRTDERVDGFLVFQKLEQFQGEVGVAFEPLLGIGESAGGQIFGDRIVDASAIIHESGE